MAETYTAMIDASEDVFIALDTFEADDDQAALVVLKKLVCEQAHGLRPGAVVHLRRQDTSEVCPPSAVFDYLR